MQAIERIYGFIETLHWSGAGSGILEGARFAVKDLFDVAGHVTGGGNPDWKAHNKAASSNAAAIDALLMAGASLEGITCTDELAFSLDGINAHYGAPVNPQYPDRISGGSSSGSASVVAQSLVDLALGTDTAGSVRVPASFCGIFGLRSSTKLISTDGVMPLSKSIDAVGWFARDAKMLHRCGQALIAKPTTSTKFHRLFIAIDAFELADDSVLIGLMQTLERLRELFGTTAEIELAKFNWKTFPDHLHRIRGWEAWQYYGKWIETAKPNLSPEIAARFEKCQSVTKEQYEQSLVFADNLQSTFDEMLGNDGLICIPTTSGLPPKLTADAAVFAENRLRTIKLTSLASVARLPELTIPCDTGNGGKSGLSLIANRNLDRSLLEFCAEHF